MKRIPFLTTVALAAVCFISSCKDSGTEGLDIPKDAAMVLHINTSSLTSKLSWDEIKSSSWFKDLSEKEHDSLAKKLFENPESSGVDIKSDFVVFLRKQGRGGYMVFEGKLKDAAAFEAMLKQRNQENNEVLTDGDLKYMKSGRDEIISWTGSKFIAMSNAPFFNQMSSMSRNRNFENHSFSADSLKLFTKQLLALKKDNRLEGDDRFSDLLKESGDIHLWLNSDQYLSSMAGGYMSMLKVGSLFEGNAGTFTLNFEEGKIAVKSKTYYGKEMAKLMDKYKAREIDEALVNRIPSEDVIGVLALNFDPAILHEFLRLSGLDGMLNAALGELNLTAEELINGTKGQFLIAVSDFQKKKKEVIIPGYGGSSSRSFSTEQNDANVMVATSVNRRSTFDTLLKMFESKMKMDQEDTTIRYKLTNDWFVVSNKKTTVDRFLAGNTTKAPYADKITGQSFGLYIDLQKAFRTMGSNLKNSQDSAFYSATVNMWQDVVAKGGEYKDGVSTGEFVINLVDKSKNSLKQLNEYGNKMHAARKLRKEEEWMGADSVQNIPPPPPPVTPGENR